MTARFAAALWDTRSADDITHSLVSMVRQRLYGVLADDEDQNDHDELRSDPVFKLIADRLPDDPDLASQPTLSRFENAVSIADLKRLREVLAQEFLDGFAVRQYAATGRKQRLVLTLPYQAGTWPVARRVAAPGRTVPHRLFRVGELVTAPPTG